MKKKNKRKFWLWGIVAVILVGLFCFLPLPFYVESPGNTENISNFITINGKALHQKGKYQLVYVEMAPVTPLVYTVTRTKPYTDLIPKKEVTGNSNYKEYETIQKYYMQSAVDSAKYVALKRAKRPATIKYRGIYVMQVQKNSSFKGRLKVGDTVEKVDGRHYNTAAEYQKAVNSGAKGRTLKLTVNHNGKNKLLKGKTVKLPDTKSYGIGIIMSDRITVKSPVKIKADMEEIGGPSAGLMMTLQMYTQLSRKNLLKGRNVGGTGTISPDGSVGEIGGVDKKVVSCNKAGCQIFFAPTEHLPGEKSNYQVAKKTARKIHSKMKVVPVRNVSDAVNYLEKTK